MKSRYLILIVFLVIFITSLVWLSFGNPFAKKTVNTPSNTSKHENHDPEEAEQRKNKHDEKDHAASEKKEDHKDHKEHTEEEKKEDHKEHGEEEEHGSHEGEGHKDEEKEGKGEEEESVGGVGKNNAVTEANEEKGIRLSEKAITAIQLKMEAYNAQSSSKNALVYYQNEIGVYRFRDQWFKLIPVKVLNRTAEKFSLLSDDLKSGDQIVTHGTGILRAAELDAFSSEAGHSH